MLKMALLTGKPQNILEKPELINNHFRDSTDNLHVQNSNAFHSDLDKTLACGHSNDRNLARFLCATGSLESIFPDQDYERGVFEMRRDWDETRVR